MNRSQAVALAIAALNVALMLLFPPHDYLSLQHGGVGTFDGFYWAFASLPNRVVNRDFLTLEILVVLINAAIAWLLLRDPDPARSDAGMNRLQRGVLLLVGINLVLALLFPPFENYRAITRAVIPTFEGFYFVFGDHSTQKIITSVLYIEVTLLLINGALAWLLFRRRGDDPGAPEEVRTAAKFRHEHDSP
ncbi:hypothetical protein [Sulfurisoma sediminicola]|uniref:Uncharacterized protein n=1 Tax=Sulfurisoma sediminicola TaxID=1381557 RepID=A0A497XJX7_9PROT|nr:hypothetical protein [Sulfurisoma sediminicola]RLJ67566.1 hypothetical protein DFR35_0113 [Sulfurisoma sediminicola]